jgi:tRNA (mo5U34)-methyltransferase
MTPDELRAEIGKRSFWYHKIDLGNGVVTPGLDFDHIWKMVRQTRERIDYRGKNVLDVASFDGMWAFEAEKLGARNVVAVDSYYSQLENFLLCRNALNSRVMPYYNVAPHELSERLDVYLQEDLFSADADPYEKLFDVVQHLGLLYHLRDPLLTLAQSRSVLKTGGYLLMETAAVVDEKGSFMLFNGTPPKDPTTGRIYPDITTWWAPTIRCLTEMLEAAMFEPLHDTIRVLERPLAGEMARKIRKHVRRYFSEDSAHTISRVSLVARAVGAKDVHREYFKELARTYRNPFLTTDFLQRT